MSGDIVPLIGEPRAANRNHCHNLIGSGLIAVSEGCGAVTGGDETTMDLSTSRRQRLPALAGWRCCCVALPRLRSHAEEKSLKGVALVIGQSKYEHIAPLANPANDAREMVKMLTDLGFDARSVSDRDAAKLKRDLERFVEDAEGADVAFLYYSGHGIESGGENCLVPVDADVSSLDNAGEALVPLSDGHGRVEEARCR